VGLRIVGRVRFVWQPSSAVSVPRPAPWVWSCSSDARGGPVGSIACWWAAC